MDYFKPRGILFSLSKGFWSSETGWSLSFDFAERYSDPDNLITSFKKTSDVVLLCEDDVITMTYGKLFSIIKEEGYSNNFTVFDFFEKNSGVFLFVKEKLGCIVIGEPSSSLVTIVNLAHQKKAKKAVLLPPELTFSKKRRFKLAS